MPGKHMKLTSKSIDAMDLWMLVTLPGVSNIDGDYLDIFLECLNGNIDVSY